MISIEDVYGILFPISEVSISHEMQNGYLGVVVDSTEVKSLVTSINKKRKSIYINLARENKITMQQVTALAGEKAIAKTQSGHFIKNASGQWVKK